MPQATQVELVTITMIRSIVCIMIITIIVVVVVIIIIIIIIIMIICERLVQTPVPQAAQVELGTRARVVGISSGASRSAGHLFLRRATSASNLFMQAVYYNGGSLIVEATLHNSAFQVLFHH